MGIYDRDYIRQPAQSSFGAMRFWSYNTWLIVINIGVFFLDRLLLNMGFVYHVTINTDEGVAKIAFSPLEGIGHFSALMAIGHLQLWRFITFQFLHADGTHIIMNMLGLFFFGSLMEQYFGSRRYLIFYLLCGVAGGFCYLILWSLHILVQAPWTPLIGASAGIFGVLIAAAQVAPDSTVLIYGIVPMRLRVMAWLLLGVAAYTVLFSGPNAGGEAAHLGGAVAGFLLVKNPRILAMLDFRRRPRMRYRP